MDTVTGRATGRPPRLRVGIADAVPKLVAYRLLRPALALPGGVRLVCTEGKAVELVAQLSQHQLDVVLSDAPVGAGVAVKAFSHLLGETGVGLFAVRPLARKLRRGFPGSLTGAPLLVPTEGTSLRAALRAFTEETGIAPEIVAEFEDGALLLAFGQTGLGVFPAPLAIAPDVKRQYGVELVGKVPEHRERFYAISVERRLRHPAVVAISQAAQRTLAAA
jgi:LysR family transcriptional activator of nhaA